MKNKRTDENNKPNKKHKYLKKIADLFSDKRSYFRRLAISAPIWLAICFTFVFFGPFELVAYSGKSLFYSYLDVAPILATAAAVVFVIGVPVLPILRGKIFNYVMTVMLSVVSSAYLQAMFFNGDFGALTGDAVDWLQHRSAMLINLAVWAGMLVLWFFILYMRRSLWRGLSTVVAVLIVLSQAVPLVGIVTGSFGPKTSFTEHEYYLSREGMFEYSDEHNVLVFILDRLDYDYIDAVAPTFFEKLDGFTSYTNAITTYARTKPALSHILTGYEGCAYDFDGDDYYKKAWTSNGKHMLRDLGAAGYRVDIYAEMNSMFSDGEFAFEYVDNTDHDKFEVPKELIFGRMMELSAYRYTPTALKPFFIRDTNYYNNGAVEIDANIPEREPYFVDESLYIDGFESITTAEGATDMEGSTKCFKFYHFNGIHSPFYLNEDGTRNEGGETNNLQQTKGTFSILYRIFDRMKELGIYEKSAIIITGDHGRAMSDTEPLQKATCVGLFYKPSGSAGTPLEYSSAPISTYNIGATILKEAGADYTAYGKAIDEVAQDEEVVRTYYKTVVGDTHSLHIYEVTGDAANFDNWVEVDVRDLPKDKY